MFLQHLSHVVIIFNVFSRFVYFLVLFSSRFFFPCRYDYSGDQMTSSAAIHHNPAVATMEEREESSSSSAPLDESQVTSVNAYRFSKTLFE
jgi:hypothetical protein